MNTKTYLTGWIVAYGCGAALVTSVVAFAFGAAAGGTVAGFLILGGIVAAEIMWRQTSYETAVKKLNALAQNQDRILRDVTRTKSDVDTLKDDMARTAHHLKSTPKADAEKSLNRMAARPRMPTPDPKTPRYDDFVARSDFRLGRPAAFQDNEDVNPADHFSDAVVEELVRHAVTSDKIEIFAQPVVKLPSRRLVYLELFARIRARAGVYVAAQRYRPLAQQHTLQTEIDHILLQHVLEVIQSNERRGIEVGYFINITAQTLRDAAFLNDAVEFLRTHKHLGHLLVLELQYADLENLNANDMAILNALSRTGYGFSIDNVSDAIRVIEDSRITSAFSFLKIDAKNLLQLSRTLEGEDTILDLKRTLTRKNIQLVITKVESEYEVKELLDFYIDYGEGWLFGKPDFEMAWKLRKSA
jgi:cyclic-di-GMP phosphodiesterase, flagellum assembly factor TipF